MFVIKLYRTDIRMSIKLSYSLEKRMNYIEGKREKRHESDWICLLEQRDGFYNSLLVMFFYLNIFTIYQNVL